MSRHSTLHIPPGWRQLVVAGQVAARLYRWPYRLVATWDYQGGLWWPGAHEMRPPLAHVILALNALTRVVCQVCGTANGERVVVPTGELVREYTMCPTHCTIVHAAPNLAACRRLLYSRRLSPERLRDGDFPLLGTGLRWRDVVHAKPASFATRLRLLERHLEGPAAALVPWVWIAALERARSEAIRTLSPTDVLPLLSNPWPAVHDRVWSLLPQLVSPAAVAVTAP